MENLPFKRLFKPISFICLLYFLMVGCKLMDLRPTTEMPKKNTGKKFLDKSVEKYGGLDNWRKNKHSSLVVKDLWPTLMWRVLSNPWKDKEVQLDFNMQHGKDNSRVTILSGKQKNKEFGIQNWCTYSVGKEISFKKNKDHKFTLPTMQYFFEFPFRITEAGIVKYIEDKEVNGVNYHVIFATWGRDEPQKNIDQYLIYINKETWIIDFIEFTVRDVGGFVYGSVKMEGLIGNDVLRFPKKITAYFQNRVPGKKVGHQMEIKSANIGGNKINDSFFILDKNKNCSK